jgi:hypothetical protein
MPDRRIAGRSLSVARFYGLAVEDGINVGLVPGGDPPWTEDELADIDLCNALLDLERFVESKRVERQWEALEELLPLVPPGGDVREVVYLPADLAVRAARLALRCGWFF